RCRRSQQSRVRANRELLIVDVGALGREPRDERDRDVDLAAVEHAVVDERDPRAWLAPEEEDLTVAVEQRDLGAHAPETVWQAEVEVDAAASDHTPRRTRARAEN